MTEQIRYFLVNIGIRHEIANSISSGVLLMLIILLCIIGLFIANRVVYRIVAHYVKNNKYKWDNIMLEHKVFQYTFHLIPPLIIRFFAESFPGYKTWIENGTAIYIIVVIIFICNAFLNAVDAIYRGFEVSKSKPIKGFLQVIKIVIFIIAGIVVIAVFMGPQVTILLGGIGALTAVFTLIFKDSILGLVAGIQLTTNDMVKIGDWIEMPKYSADGVVTDLSLNTVKVENFDRTITTIPAYALISDSFKNWRGMELSGGRRIMRSISIDTNSVAFCSDEMLADYKKIHYLKTYIEEKRIEIEKYNKEQKSDLDQQANGRRLTNIGVFRIYIQNYLQHHPGIHHEMILMVRQLASEGRGLPLQIYAFANDISWTKYENIQADIFDHLLAVLPEFGLRIFQEPTGSDIKEGMSQISQSHLYKDE